MNKKIIIGSHVSMNKPQYLVGSINTSLSYGANAFMIYTGAPQNLNRTDLSLLRIDEYKKIASENNINLENVVVHAPYVMNLASNDDIKHIFHTNTLITEAYRSKAIGSKYLVIHPGFAVGGLSRDVAIKNIADSINKAIKKVPITYTLETMSGKGSEIGVNFEEISKIISLIKNKECVAVCLDTCHISDSGYDLNDVDALLNHFDDIVGLKYLKVMHVNDSMNVKGSHKDRHQNIGYGEIGFEKINKIVNHPKLMDVIKILETPYDSKPFYKEEIEILRSQEWYDFKK